MDRERKTTGPVGVLGRGFKIAEIRDLQTLEGGTYWPELHPYFIRPDYQRLRYSIRGKARGKHASGDTLSVRAASKAGELDVAFIADRLAATMFIVDAGLPDYCLTWVSEGQLAFSGPIKSSLLIDKDVGLIYRGHPDTALVATDAHERLAIWIPRASLTQRLVALLDGPVAADAEFQPAFDWNGQHVRALRHLVELLMLELQAPAQSILGSEAATRSFVDLLIYTLLRSVPNTYSERIDRPGASAAPGTLRRAETYIRSHAEEPIALHEVAAAAGCSVRTLQLVFRSFKETTPLLFIRQSRLEAARDAIRSSDCGITVTELALRFGFANPGRFTRLYRNAFGESPADVMRRRRT
ncbi:AraC family transcriptional regulator [Roseovarius autotrophicus]|uniref:AraC family transcriptional regulator n=1 Tax=Roseovarius autotrophicus TaxID=2824121 RepID=UPI001B38C865|nr:AraC family transcriptional regulator [Roseovarius autotrophicus]